MKIQKKGLFNDSVKQPYDLRSCITSGISRLGILIRQGHTVRISLSEFLIA
jgi:hypothetical protein